jgi:hypothetical protein
MLPRYSVYRRESDGLIAKEFAFSVEYVRAFGVSWFAMHNDERETWMAATLVGILRSEKAFRVAYDSFMDHILEDQRLLRRQADGYLGPVPNPRPPAEWIAAYVEIQAGLKRERFADRAAEVLNRAGVEAWVNSTGCVAVRPDRIPK